MMVHTTSKPLQPSLGPGKGGKTQTVPMQQQQKKKISMSLHCYVEFKAAT